MSLPPMFDTSRGIYAWPPAGPGQAAPAPLHLHGAPTMQSPLNSLAALQAAAVEASLQNSLPGFSYGWGAPQVSPQPNPAASSSTSAQSLEELAAVPLVASANMGPSLAHFFDTELLSDVVVRADDGCRLHCHRLVLIRWSAPLQQMLTGGMREARDREVLFSDVDSGVLRSFLQFLYGCSTTVQVEQLVALYALADQYDVGLLMQLCMHAITKHCADQRCCCRLFLEAKAHGLDAIRDMCWRHMSANVSGMLAQGSRDFVQLELADIWRLCCRHSSSCSIGGSGGSGGGSSSSGGGGGGGGKNAGSSRSTMAGSSSSSSGGPGTPANLSTGGAAAASPSSSAAAPAPPDTNASAPSALNAAPGCQPPGGLLAPLSPQASEYVIFQAIMTWVEADRAARMPHLEQLLACVKFDLMGYMELAQVRSHPVGSHCAALKDLLLDAYQRHHEAMGYHVGYMAGGGMYGWASSRPG